MYVEQFEIFGGNQQFEYVVGVVGDLVVGQFLVVGYFYFVWDGVFGQFYFGGVDVGYFGN